MITTLTEDKPLVISPVKFENTVTSLTVQEQPAEVLPMDPQTAQEVAAARKELNLQDSSSLIFFGSRSQAGLTDISTKMIAGVKNKDIEPASAALNGIVLNIRGFKLDDLKSSGAVGWFKSTLLRTVSPVVSAMQRYESVENQINVVINDLDRHIGILMRDVVGLDRMYAEALIAFRKLKIYIMAGEQELAHITDVVMPDLKSRIRDDDPLSSQNVNNMENVRQRLERRVHDLKLTRQVVMQSLPMIIMMQDNDSNLVEKIQSAIVNTVPLWKQQVAMLITARHAEKAAKAVGAVSDLTNDLLVKTADAMRVSNKTVRAEVERGIFDTDAIKRANDTVIGTITDALGTYEKAAARRREEAKVLDSCEADLRRVLENSKRESAAGSAAGGSGSLPSFVVR